MKKLLLIALLFLYPFISKGQTTFSFCTIEVYKYNNYSRSYYLDKTTTSVGYMYTTDDAIRIYVDGELYFNYAKADLKVESNKTQDGVSVVVLSHKIDKDIFIQATGKWVAVGKYNDYKIIFNLCN
jgi:hypothetical protein